MRLIIDPPASGTWNMAVDEALLAEAVESDIATLRLYQWCEPTLSLGYFQRYEDRHEHAASRGVAIVRRQSGGGAILHDRELTYSLALPEKHPLTRRADELYTAVHQAIIDLLTPPVAAVAPGWRLALRGCENCGAGSAAREPFLCFQRRAAGDLLLVDSSAAGAGGPAVPDWKILGSAQRRHRGAILQHGSLLLEGSPAAPELPGINDLTGTTLTAADVAAALPGRLAAALALEFREQPLPRDVQESAARIETPKYAAAEWTNRR